MDCIGARELVQRQCDGEGTPTEAAGLAIHLSTCEACRLYARQMQELLSGLDELRRETAGIAVSRARTTDPRHKRWSLVRWAGWLSAAAAIAAVLLARTTWNPRPSPSATQVASPAVATNEATCQVDLEAESAENFIAVEQPTSQPRVRVYMLVPTVRQQS
jgi:predicted anti-sigma-YlaC factor YlaD